MSVPETGPRMPTGTFDEVAGRLKDYLAYATHIATSCREAIGKLQYEERGPSSGFRAAIAHLHGRSEHDELLNVLNPAQMVEENPPATPDLERFMDGLRGVHDSLPPIAQAQLCRDLSELQNEVDFAVGDALVMLRDSSNLTPLQRARDSVAGSSSVDAQPLTIDGVRQLVGQLVDSVDAAADRVFPTEGGPGILTGLVHDILGPTADELVEGADALASEAEPGALGHDAFEPARPDTITEPGGEHEPAQPGVVTPTELAALDPTPVPGTLPRPATLDAIEAPAEPAAHEPATDVVDEPATLEPAGSDESRAPADDDWAPYRPDEAPEPEPPARVVDAPTNPHDSIGGAL